MKNDKEIALERIEFIATSDDIKKEIRDAARNVKKKTHEQINASSQAEFLINVAIGKQVSNTGKTFERTAKLKNGEEISITNLAEKLRLSTVELPVKPELIQDINNVANKTKDRDQYVLPGHTGATFFGKGKPSQLNQVVSSRSASTGIESIHQAQIDAINQSSHHLSLSTRLSKIRDEYQENGLSILKAEEDKGFHPDSNWYGFYLNSKENVLAASTMANSIFKKTQTKEKHIRKHYSVPIDLSDKYEEIRTESETKTDEQIDYIKRKVIQKPEFKTFAEKHNIDTNDRSFVDKLDSLAKAISKGKGRAK